nr:histidine kinase [Bacteroidales bacterium]
PESSQVCYIYEDPLDGSVLVGADDGLYYLSINRWKFFSLEQNPLMGVVEGMSRLDDGTYLLSGHQGLSIFDLTKVIPVRDSILPEDYTFTLAKDPWGGVWITSAEGLFFRDPFTMAYSPGLPDVTNKPANSIILMDSIHVMVGRGSDICIIDLKRFYAGESSYFRVYDKSDGFEGSDCIDNGIIKDVNGIFWILTANRLVRFDKEKLKEDRRPPLIHITGVFYQDDSLQWKQASDGRLYFEIPSQVPVPSESRKLKISFTGISTKNPEKVRYSYRLTGLSEKWSDPSPERNVVYENLSPGNYKFELRASNADGYETPVPIVLPLRIMPAFWQTLAFKILSIVFSVILIITLTYLYISWRQKSKKSAENLRQELTNLQISSVVKQFDPHFTFNVINSVGALILEGKRDAAYDYITKLSSLLRRTFREGELVVRPVADEIDFVSQYCELQKLRFNDRFSYSIDVSSAVDTSRPVPRMIIQIFVENAVKHGFGERPEGGRVDVGLSIVNGGLLITVRDDGIGRSANPLSPASGSGNGIMLVSSIFMIMNERNSLRSSLEIQDLVSDGKAAGTEVRIFIPEGYDFVFK